jgi:hypothetical protein
MNKEKYNVGGCENFCEWHELAEEVHMNGIIFERFENFLEICQKYV